MFNREDRVRMPSGLVADSTRSGGASGSAVRTRGPACATVVILAAMPGVSRSAVAQEGAEGGMEQLAEVVVTAQKRAQNLQDVGTSITAFDGNSLARLGVTDLSDVVRQVPGLQFNEFAPSIIVFNLRGVSQNDFSDHQEAPVAVYSDEVYVASMGAIAGALYDIERVETLRGPQGTLFGRNATGGLIQYISRRPTDEPDGYAKVTGGRFSEIDTEGAVGGRLWDGVDGRFSFATSHHDGYVTNRIGPNGGSQNQYAARSQMLFKLDDSGEFVLKLYGIRNLHEVPTAYSWTAAYPNSQGLGVPLPPNVNYWGTCPGCDIDGYRNPSNNPYNQAYGRPGAGIFDRSLYGATGHLTWNFGGVTLTSITDYQHMHKRYGEDSDGSPILLVYYDTWQQYRQFSQEMRLNGQVDRLRWIAGLYYLDILTQDQVQNTLGAILGGPVGTIYDIKTRSWAGFAQGEWQISDHWTAILGGRVTEDERTDNYLLYAPTPQTVVTTFNTALYPDLAHRTWVLPSGKAEIDYKIDRDDMLYASINRGVKGGGFSQPAAVPPTSPNLLGFGPEKLTSYEVGSKSTFLEGRARFNADIFYYDYKDYQAYEQIGFIQSIVNLRSRIKGAEAELAVVPAKGLELQLGVAGLSTVIKNVTLPAGQVADRVMPQAPKWSVNAQARYQWSALDSTWSIEADAKADTPYYFSSFNSPADREPGHTVANARVGYTNKKGNIDVALFCRNLNNKLYRVYDLDLSSASIIVPVYAPPRWWGGSITYHWQ
jgi:iron complex outermembrane receptor protein